jgi:hypothetical protein
MRCTTLGIRPAGRAHANRGEDLIPLLVTQAVKTLCQAAVAPPQVGQSAAV